MVVVVVVMEKRKETDYSPMLENARLKVKWFAMQMTFDIHLLNCLSAQDMFLFLLMMMMIFSRCAHMLICWCHVRRLSDDEENCLIPPRIHGPGRC